MTYGVRDPSDRILTWGDIPTHMRELQDVDKVASWSSKAKAKLVRNYMGGGRASSVESGFTVCKLGD